MPIKRISYFKAYFILADN